MAKQLSLILIAFMALACHAKLQLGTCPEVVPFAELEVAPYLGLWYEERRIDYVYEEFMDCNTAIYSDLGDGTVGVHNTGRTRAGNYTEIYGTAVVAAPGELSVSFPGHDSEGKVNYIVLYTDYDTYSCVYNCDQVGEFMDSFGWILSREVPLDAATINEAFNVFETNGVNVTLFNEPTYQGADCPYYTP